MSTRTVLSALVVFAFAPGLAAAQRLNAIPRPYYEPWVTWSPPKNLERPLTLPAASAEPNRRTHVWTGAILGGGLLTIGGVVGAQELCSPSDNCTGTTITFGLLGAVIGTVVGGIIGSTIPKQ